MFFICIITEESWQKSPVSRFPIKFCSFRSKSAVTISTQAEAAPH